MLKIPYYVSVTIGKWKVRGVGNKLGRESFICFICGFTSQSTTIVMPRRSVNLTTLFLGKLPKRLTSTKCPSFCQKLTTALLESATGRRNDFMIRSISTKKCCRTGGSNLRPSARQTDAQPMCIPENLSFTL